MVQLVEACVGLLGVIAAVSILSKWVKVPGPILLVPIGLALAFLPGVPHVPLNPDLVLTVFLPPLVYSAAVRTSWPDFRGSLRAIGLLAVGCVLFTTAAVAVVAHFAIGLPWAVAAVLGAVVSPPDTVAITALAGQLSIPRRIRTILEGEGLVNDATALILYKFAVGAVVYGTFSAWRAGGAFAAVVAGETLWGVAVGWVLTRCRRWADDARAEVTLSLIAPFVAYLPAEQMGGSGVLATAVAGLWVSWNGWETISSATRLQASFFWDLGVFVVEGLLFLLTGLQFRTIRAGLSAETWRELLLDAAIVCPLVIAVRFLWVFPATYLPRWSRWVAKDDPSPPWQSPFVVSFAGMRGAISLAAALALPFETATGGSGGGHGKLPDRDLIIYLTFCVILVTLVGQGLSLPWLIRRLGLDVRGRAERDDEGRRGWDARIETAKASLARLDELTAAEGNGVDGEVVDALRAHVQGRLRHLSHHRADDDDVGDRIDHVERQLIAAARHRLYDLVRRGEVGDDARRQIEHELDLEEARILHEGE